MDEGPARGQGSNSLESVTSGGAVLRTDLLGSDRQFVWPRGEHNRVAWRALPLLEPLQGAGVIGSGRWRGCLRHGECQRRRDRWTLHSRLEGKFSSNLSIVIFLSFSSIRKKIFSFKKSERNVYRFD